MALITVDRRFLTAPIKQTAEDQMEKARAAFHDLARQADEGAQWTGWLGYPQREGAGLAQTIKQQVANLGVFFDLVVVVGIGGSYLGTRAVSEALKHSYDGLVKTVKGKRPLMLYAGHHLSEGALVDILDVLDGHEPVINVISKSGTTTEPAIAFRVLRHYLEARYGEKEAARRIIVTTDPAEGALRKLSVQKGYLAYPVPPAIGGRYSVLTPVGLVPLALGGFAVENLMQGADDFFTDLFASPKENPALRYAADRQAAWDAGVAIEVLSITSPKLAFLAEWWKQLFGESQGKEGKGIFPASFAMTTDLHSLGQYLQEGPRHLLETFLTFDEQSAAARQAVDRRVKIPHFAENTDGLGYLENRFVEEVNRTAVQGTKLAHADSGISCLEIATAKLDEYHLGALFAFFETACAVGGMLLGVNPFDQPGVEAYKKNLFALLGKPGTENLGAEIRRRLK